MDLFEMFNKYKNKIAAILIITVFLYIAAEINCF